MDWSDLQFLLAVERGGSLLGAARTLGVDKATVSRRIATLEESLRVRLFDRKPEGYTLTLQGKRVVATVCEIDQAVTALTTDLSEAQGDSVGTVYLTLPHFFACRLLIPALPAFRARHPKVDLVVADSSAVLNIAQREAEVALRNARAKHASLTSRRAGELAVALYGARAYLDTHGTPRTQADVASHDLIGFDRAVAFSSDFAWIAQTGARVVLRATDAETIGAAAASGLGLAVLPCLVGDSYPTLVRLSSFGVPQETIYVIAPAELRKSVRVRAVIQLLLDVFGEHAKACLGLG